MIFGFCDFFSSYVISPFSRQIRGEWRRFDFRFWPIAHSASPVRGSAARTVSCIGCQPFCSNTVLMGVQTKRVLSSAAAARQSCRPRAGASWAEKSEMAVSRERHLHSRQRNTSVRSWQVWMLGCLVILYTVRLYDAPLDRDLPCQRNCASPDSPDSISSIVRRRQPACRVSRRDTLAKLACRSRDARNHTHGMRL